MKNFESNVTGNLFENEEENKMANTFKIYTDGSCLVDSKCGGWAYVYADGSQEKSDSSKNDTTNNAMELTAIGAAIASTPDDSNIEIITDSEYAVNVISGNWKRNKNFRLLRRIDELLKTRTVKFTWVKGHSGDPMNERCDKLAKEAAKRKLADKKVEEEISMKKKNSVEVKKVELALKKAMLGFAMRIAHSITGSTYLNPAKNYERVAAKVIGIKPVDFKAFTNTDATKQEAEKYYRDYFEEILSAQSVEEPEEVTDEVKNTPTDETIVDDKEIPTAEVPQDNQITIPHEEVKKVVKPKQFDNNIVEIADINNDACIETALNDITDLENTEIVFDANISDTDRVCGVIKTIYGFTDKLRRCIHKRFSSV